VLARDGGCGWRTDSCTRTIARRRHRLLEDRIMHANRHTTSADVRARDPDSAQASASMRGLMPQPARGCSSHLESDEKRMGFGDRQAMTEGSTSTTCRGRAMQDGFFGGLADLRGRRTCAFELPIVLEFGFWQKGIDLALDRAARLLRAAPSGSSCWANGEPRIRRSTHGGDVPGAGLE